MAVHAEHARPLLHVTRPDRAEAAGAAAKHRPGEQAGAAGHRKQGDRQLPRIGQAPRPAHGGASCRSVVRPRGSGIRSRADLAPRPALDLPVDQRALDARDRPAAHPAQQAARRRTRGGTPGARPRAADRVHAQGVSLPASQHVPDPHPRRLSPRPGALHRARFRDHRLRRRAHPHALRAPAQAPGDERRGRDAAVLLVREPGRASVAGHDPGALRRAPGLGSILGGLRVRGVLQDVPCDRRERLLGAAEPGRPRAAADDDAAGEGAVRVALRAEPEA